MKRLAAVLALALIAAPAAAEDREALAGAGVAALKAGRPGDAIENFEALADRGVVDPNMSLDRGLAYALRVKLGADLPGDLGRAAHGFEEAKDLAANDTALAEDAARALAIVRAEVARRRARAGEPASVDPGLSLGRSVVRIASEDAWALLALAASLALGVGLFVRDLAATRRGKIAGAIVASVAAPTLIACALLAAAARDERLHRKEGVVISPSARVADADHRPLPGAASIPEAARVEVQGARSGWTHIRWAGVDGWLPSTAVRDLAR
jgi:hypothetical protein